MKTAFAALPAAKSTADLAKAKSTGGGESVQAVGTPGQPVPPPSSQYRDIRGGNVFRASVPSNWTALSSSSAVKVVPQNGYGPYKGETVFSHGVEFGVAKAASRDLQDATDAWVKAVTQSNPGLRVAGSQKTTRISQRFGPQHAAREPFPARRPGAHRRLHDVPGRWQPVLLHDGDAGERRRCASRRVPTRGRVDSVDGNALIPSRRRAFRPSVSPQFVSVNSACSALYVATRREAPSPGPRRSRGAQARSWRARPP